MRPIVQVSLKNFEQRKQVITKELWDAANDVGFFYLKDHGLTEASFHDRCSKLCTVLRGRPDRPVADTLADRNVLSAVMPILCLKTMTARRMRCNTCSAYRKPSSTCRLT